MHVLIGPPPGIYRHTDRWGAWTNQFGYYLPVRVNDDFWKTLQRYQAPFPKPTPEVAAAIQRNAGTGNIGVVPTGSPAADAFLADFTRQLAAFGRAPETLHQFEAWSDFHRDFVRQVAVAGEQWFRPWTRFDRWIRYPASVVWARLRTFLGSLLPARPL